MLIAVCVAVGLLFLFILFSFIMTYKKYEFEIEGSKILIKNIGSHLKIYVDGNLYNDFFAPKLIKGESYKLDLGQKNVTVHCKSSGLGYKFRIQVEMDGKIVADNGVKLKDNK